jgi:uncharacterized protein YecE (DUF72 family)
MPDQEPRECPGQVRFGTSSFSWEDWVGPFYPAGAQPADFLRHYARVFDTVEVDSTYYAIPSLRTVEGWVRKTPESFLLSAKFPRSIVHAGEGPRPDPSRILDPDSTYAVRDEFLTVMCRLGPRLGPLVLQFPFFSKESFDSPAAFLERLGRFLGDLPRDFRYGVEVRNRDWMSHDLAAICRENGVALVLVDQAWMPHGDRVERKLDPVTADFVYVRLLGDRHKTEALTTTWDREVLDHAERLERWAAFLLRMLQRPVLSLVYVNNHYAGHAPATVRRLQTLVQSAAQAAGLRADVGLPTAEPPPFELTGE